MSSIWHTQPGLTFTNTTGGYGNLTLYNNTNLCTVQTCSMQFAQFRYIPTLGGNTVYAVIFAIFFFSQIGLGLVHRTWGYMAATFFGLLLETIGYVARIRMHFSPFNHDDFLMYLVALTIAPAFLSAAIYLCLSRIVIVYGTHLSRFRPRTYTIVFCSCDFISLLLQAVGGGIAASTNQKALLNTGKNIMLAGLAFQVFSTILFAIAAGWFAKNVWSSKGSWNTRYSDLIHSRLFKAFLIGLVVATFTIFIRSVYRCVELSGGFGGHLFVSDEALFMVLEGVMLVFAGTCLTVLHPGIAFQGQWRDVNYSFHHKGENLEKNIGGSSSEASIVEQGPARPGRVQYHSQPSRPYSNQPSGPYVAQSNASYVSQYGPGGRI